MNYSDYLNLKLPEQTDQYNVDDDNYNSNIIDNSIKNLDNIAQYITFEIWQNTKTYSKNKCVSKIVSDELKLYQSLQNSNTGKDPESETTYWKDISFILKTGDTMTGTLEFDKSLTGISPTEYVCTRRQLNHTIDANNLPANHVYGNTDIVVDLDNKRCFRQYDRYSTSGMYTHNIQVTNYDTSGTVHDAAIALTVDMDGNGYFQFPKCDTKATTTSSASSNKVAVVTKNYVNGTSWYRVWSDGWIEQGGLSTGVNSKNITFLKPFSNANYVLIASIINESHYSYLPMLNNKTANGFSYQINYGGTSIVTGDCNYYACGY